MKKGVVFIVFAILSAIVAWTDFNAASRGVGEELPVCGGVTDYTDVNAPKKIKSKNIVSFSTHFFLYDQYEYEEKSGVYDIEVGKNEKGEIILSVQGVYNHELAVTDQIFADIQDIIDQYGLVENNGAGRVTAGLSPEYQPWSLSAVYNSGENLYFYENGRPDADWTAAFQDYFIHVMADAGYEDVLPPKDAETTEPKLISYRNSSSGGMNGGSWREEINRMGDDVVLTYAFQDWWYEDPTVMEYRVDPQILDDMGYVFEKNDMQDWSSEKMKGMEVLDGPSYSYIFEFEDGNYVSFSSQTFPDPYGEKLDELSAIINDYKKSGILLPGLVLKEQTEEELMNRNHPNHGLVGIKVYEYCADTLCVRIMNGTDQDVEMEHAMKVVKNSDGKVLYEKTTDYVDKIYAESVDEIYVPISERLEEGVYTLYLADYSTEFEIRLREND